MPSVPTPQAARAPKPLMESTLRAENVWRNYHHVCAVAGVSLELGKGQILGLLGLNGAGKSTLLKLVCGVLAPHQGQIRIAGHDIVEDATSARKHVGFMPEQAPAYSDLTVLESLSFQARLHGVGSAELADSVARACQLCGLNDFKHRLGGHLSHGYRKRLGIALALVHRPSLLVLDEPSSGLDPIQIKGMRELIRDMASDCAIIFSSHVLSEVQELCNMVLILHKGKAVLNQDIEGGESGFSILLDNPPPAEQIEAALGVAVSDSGNGRFHVADNDSGTICQLLLRENLDKGWGLRELTPQPDKLEQTFLKVVRDAGHDH